MTMTQREVLPGVHHIQDGLGVCMTLLVGEKRALLVDTGYGIENVAAYAASLTDKPLTVILTHGHHDHALGAKWFPQTRMFQEDAADFETFSGEGTRRRILKSAMARNLPVDEAAFMNDAIPMPAPLAEEEIALGGMTTQVLRCPGHTPGSAVVYVPERKLLLSGDDWNPCTWLFFPAALPVWDYLRNVRSMQKLPYMQVLCSHHPALFERGMMDAFLNGLTEDALRNAPPVRMPGWETIDTHQLRLPQEQQLVFDYRKAFPNGR